MTTTAAATAVGASGVFSLGSQLLLPSIAGVVIVAADVPLSGFAPVIVTAALVLAALVVVVVFTLGSEQRTERVARRLDRVVRRALRWLRRPEPDGHLGDLAVRQRRIAIGHVATVWPRATVATILTALARWGLLVMTLSFAGVPSSALDPVAVFTVYGLVAGVTAIPVTPGSAGVAEIGYVGMLTAIAGQGWVNEITAGVLLFRLLTWIVIIPVGLGALAVWRLELVGRG